MKKLFALLLAVALFALPLTGCAGVLSALSSAGAPAAQPTVALPLLTDGAPQATAVPSGGLTLLESDGATTDSGPGVTHAPLTLLEDNAPADTQQPAPKRTATPKPAAAPKRTATPEPAIDEQGSYTSRDDVALYLFTYGRLPQNFITKNEARALGWSGGGLDDYAYGKCIGGDRFGNYEGLLPERSGRRYTECDIGTLHKGSRGAKRIIFSNDGLIYYTNDHYESFTLLYGEE